MDVLDNKVPIAVVGLGYVGLPLAVEFGKSRPVIGFDIDIDRISELRQGNDRTMELDTKEISSSGHLFFTSDPADLAAASIYIVTVPTPINAHKRPNLAPLIAASETVGKVLKTGDIVIYESTVYPGATEEECVPVLERASGLIYNKDFYCGYSPERINPGDKSRTLTQICKVTSGSTPDVADVVDKLYAGIISAGTYKAPSIQVAEAAKVIENTQRDLNIALVNELALIFNRMGIDTQAVLDAAGTKWNFLPFRPGLVGGHCIGVDPYYLTHKAEEIGYFPEIVLAGRRLNDQMGAYIARRLVQAMIKRRIHVDGAKILVLGLTFKENCPDLRNTKVIDVVRELQQFGANIDVYDPWASSHDAFHLYGLELTQELKNGSYDGIVIAVAHEQFEHMGAKTLRALGKPNHIIYDLKYVLASNESDLRL